MKTQLLPGRIPGIIMEYNENRVFGLLPGRMVENNILFTANLPGILPGILPGRNQKPTILPGRIGKTAILPSILPGICNA